MNSIKEKFKDRFEELADEESIDGDYVMGESAFLNALDSIDQYLEEQRKIRKNEVLRQHTERMKQHKLNIKTDNTEVIIKAQERIEELEGRNREFLEALTNLLDEVEHYSHVCGKTIEECSSLIAKYKGGDGETNQEAKESH